MCDDLNKAIETHETLGVKLDKGTMMLIKAAASSIKKSNAALQKHISESDEKLTRIDQKVDNLAHAFEDYKLDATKYRLIVEMFKALFGSAKRTIMTMLCVGVLFGLVNMKDILEILKMMI